MSKNPAVEVGKEIAKDASTDEIHAPYGAIFTIQPVATPLIQQVTSRIVDPPVPTFFNEDMQREEENPNHPDYIAAVEKADSDRGLAMIDALILFGLVMKQAPTSDEWLANLKFMERRGQIDLSEYDLDDEYDRIYVFKKFIVANNDLIRQITRKSGVAPEEVKLQEDAFQGNS